MSLLCGIALVGLTAGAVVSGGLPAQVYVWQRAWTPPVNEAVSAHAGQFTETAVLLAEVAWKKSAPQVVFAAVDWSVLASNRVPVGLVLRVGPFAGKLAEDSSRVDFLARLATQLVVQAQQGGVEPVELQIDYDCATSRLEDYRDWLRVVQQRLAPLPVTITALPSWLDSPAFATLAAAATNYVLQVHSLVKPARVDDPLTLCDPAAARRAVARAGQLGIPFRVALPTYSYRVAFDAAGKFAGLSAEANHTSWPTGTQVRVMAADPLALFSLVQGWATNHPAALQSVIWYRLPVATDELNWRWPTLNALLTGHLPQEKIRAVARKTEPGLVEISVLNDGELDLSVPAAIVVIWTDARLVAGDGLRDFELMEPGRNTVRFQTHQPQFRLPAGARRVVGWLRFEREIEVQLEVQK